jgi:hypothetical protein
LWQLAATKPPLTFDLALFECLASNLNMLRSATFIMLCALVFVVYYEIASHKKLTLLAVGCIFFTYCLLAWERGVFVYHYGVPIIGHFFEKPEYQAKYYVELEPKKSLF